MTIEALAQRILIELRMRDTLYAHVRPENEEEWEKVKAHVCRILIGQDSGDEPDENFRKGLPDRQPDFVIWADYSHDSEVEVTIMPSSIAAGPDWVACAERLLHEATTRFAKDAKVSYPNALQQIVQGAVECAQQERQYGQSPATGSE